MDEQGQPLTVGDRIAWLGLFLVGLLCIARAMIEHDPFPWWSSDPFVFSPPLTGFTPRWALLLNAGIVLASGLTFLGQRLRGQGFSSLNALLILAGFAVIAFHASHDLERTLDASTIAATIAALAAGMQARSVPGAMRVFGAVTLGFALMLTAVGVHEVFVSHPQTLAMYEETRDSFLAARGWSEESFEAMSYERRLRNPEPIAWFGLTNVFASFVAASGAALLTLGITCWRTRRPLGMAALAASGISLFGLYLCGSKGGFAVFAIGLLIGAVTLTSIRKHVHGKLVLTICGLAIGALLVRGLVGESLGERSLLFRFQYLVGSVNVWLADPLLGCGPGMFQDRYALLKPALSPEDVASPHNVIFDWVATLGIGGIAFCLFLARTIHSAACGVQSPVEEASTHEPNRADSIKLAGLLIALATIVSLRIQLPVLSGSEIVPVFIGLAIWVGLAAILISRGFDERAIRIGLFIAMSVLMVHSMIEVTATLIVSAPIWAWMVGLPAGPVRQEHPSRRGSLAMICVLGLMSVLLLARWAPINRWERGLHHAASDASAIAQIRDALNGLEFSRTPREDLDRVAERLSIMSGARVSGTLDSIIPALNQAELAARSDAIDRLLISLDARPTHTPTRIAISQQMLWVASVRLGIGQPDAASAGWDRAIELFEGIDLDAQGHRWHASMWLGRSKAFAQDSQRDGWLQNAIEQYQLAHALSPHEPNLPYQLMLLSIETGDQEQAQDWASLALTLHEQMRLDPIRGLSEPELDLVRSNLGP
ncbi:MAG: O-antigen ligase family protein [Phycisphaerales bacterium]